MSDLPPPEHEHLATCDHSIPEPDPFHDAYGNPIPEDPQELAEFGQACWEQHLDPEEVGRVLRGES